MRSQRPSLDLPASWNVKGYDRLVTIGELAARTGVSARAIRYYEGIGVLPQARRSPGGYRLYTDAARTRLSFIRAAQAVGLTLGEIGEVLAFRDRGETPCAHVLAVLESHAIALEQRIAELEQLRSEVVRLARRGRRLDPATCSPSAICHVISR